jgi:hypothetical protein
VPLGDLADLVHVNRVLGDVGEEVGRAAVAGPVDGGPSIDLRLPTAREAGRTRSGRSHAVLSVVPKSLTSCPPRLSSMSSSSDQPA